MEEDSKEVKSSFLRVIIIKSQDATSSNFLDTPIEFITSNVNKVIGRDNYIPFDNLEGGDYYMYVEMDWHKTTKKFHFSVTSYGQSFVTFHPNVISEVPKDQVLTKIFT